MNRAQAIMMSMKAEARIIFLIMYGPDVRVLLITAQENEMLEGTPLPLYLYQIVSIKY